MTETRFTWRWLFVFAAAGVVAGLVLGLIVGWVIPLGGNAPVNVSALSAGAQNDYIILVANSYAFDDDLPRAKQRLDLLKDSNIKARVETLAKALATRKDSYAANVADLAVALGSTDASLKVLAAQVSNDAGGEPTKVARVETPPTATPKPTKVATAKVATDTPAATETSEEPADTPVKPTKAAVTPAPKNTTAPKPQATNPPVAAAALLPQFEPEFPSMWWDDVKFIPANVSSGQQFWHLKYAKYCDWSPNEAHNTCPNMPGGIMDHSIYIMAVDEAGKCVNTDATDTLNDGSSFPLTADKLKPIPYAWNPFGYSCNQDYEKEMYGEGNDISIPGLPSDKITNLCLCNKTAVEGKNIMQGHAHVRYFLIFQRTTR